MKKNLVLKVYIYRGLYYPVIGEIIVYFVNHCKDPYQTTSIMESKAAFFFVCLTWSQQTSPIWVFPAPKVSESLMAAQGVISRDPEVG